MARLSSLHIANAWFHRPELQYKSHKHNHVAILILATIVYWYRPTAVRDALTGNIREWRSKFRFDKLQMSYSTLSRKLGCAKSQAQRACHFLANRGFLTLEFRNSKAGNNLLFIEPVVEKLKESLTPYRSPE